MLSEVISLVVSSVWHSGEERKGQGERDSTAVASRQLVQLGLLEWSATRGKRVVLGLIFGVRDWAMIPRL